jgi:hypothetical protein
VKAMADWRSKAFAAVEKAEKKRVPQTTAWGAQYHIRMTRPFRAFMKAAAETRGISMSGYARRALAKQIAADLGMPLVELLALTPYPPAFGKRLPDEAHQGIEKRARRDGRVMHVTVCLPDDGTGFGDWS